MKPQIVPSSLFLASLAVMESSILPLRLTPLYQMAKLLLLHDGTFIPGSRCPNVQSVYVLSLHKLQKARVLD